MTNLREIQQFLTPKKIAVAGASRNSKKFGGTIFQELKARGFELSPVNQNAEEIQGVPCYQSVQDLPPEIKHLYIVTPRKSTDSVVNDAISRGMDMIWIQQKSETPEAIKAIKEAGIPLIHNKCIMMFADPVKGPHKFHRFLAKVFGSYPKNNG